MISPIDLLLPPGCALCRSTAAPVCTDCLAGLPLLEDPICARCGAATAVATSDCRSCRGRRLGFACARSALHYEGSGRDLVHAFKDGGLRGLAVPAAALIALACPRPMAADLVTWVPADPWRLIRRGFHPPELLARELARRWGIPAAAAARSVSHRPPQRGSDRDARRRNVRGAFAVREAPAASTVVLVDDVHTTGATLSECARVLRRAGIGDVFAVSLARAGR
ncbi:MAG TPA: ComF family protein [Gaiellales bacterium]|nr:ComF family protein [Gaiellales bacterium]